MSSVKTPFPYYEGCNYGKKQYYSPAASHHAGGRQYDNTDTIIL